MGSQLCVENQTPSGGSIAGIPLPATPPPGPDYALVYNGTAFEWRDTGQEIMVANVGFTSYSVSWYLGEYIGVNTLNLTYADPVQCAGYAELGSAEYKQFRITYDYSQDNPGTLAIYKSSGGGFVNTGITIPIVPGQKFGVNDVATLTLNKGEMIVCRFETGPEAFYPGKLQVFALRYSKTKG